MILHSHKSLMTGMRHWILIIHILPIFGLSNADKMYLLERCGLYYTQNHLKQVFFVSVSNRSKYILLARFIPSLFHIFSLT